MNESVLHKPIFPKINAPIYFGFILLTIINFIYVAFEIQRPHALRAMGFGPGSSGISVTETEVAQITAVANKSLLFESAFIILSIVCILLFFTKRLRPFFTGYMIMAFSFLSLLHILNVIVAAIFDANSGNLNQQLIIPFQFLIGACIYGFIKYRKQID